MRIFGMIVALLLVSATYAQKDDEVVFSGSIQSDVLIPQDDDVIGATTDNDWAKTNTYADMNLRYRNLEAGLRLEYLDHPLPGYESDFKGWGVPHYFVTAKWKRLELTAGSFYEQFGSGLVLRTYEDRPLGIDNALLGGRVVVHPTDGLTLKALSGKQRRYWHHNDGLVSGADAEANIDTWLPALRHHDLRLTIGASWVNKYEPDEDIFADPTHRWNLPNYVNAWDARAALFKGPWNVLMEYAHKTQDPTFDNGYSYDNGSAAMLSASYTQRGLSVLLQARRSENFAFRSRRTMTGLSSTINHLPAFTTDHTYALPALYPYATQLATGEWAWQAEAGYTLKRNTALGGRYGTQLKANFSYVQDLDCKTTYYQDLNVQMTRRLNRDLKLTLFYMNQRYNKTVVEGEGGMIHANIFVADGLYSLSPKTRLRAELQYLTTPDDEGDWAFGLLELSLAPHWMFTACDAWNCGTSKIHYYQGLVTYSTGAHRLQVGYGRVQEGLNCSGGVCRYVPATKGFTIGYNYNF